VGVLADTTSRVAHAARIGADIATTPSNALLQITKYSLTDKGIQTFKEDETRTGSLVTCCNGDHVRSVQTIYLFTRERSHEIRL
jgi:hypothetical protein